MPQAVRFGHSGKALVEGALADDLLDPYKKMVLDHAFMQLMEDVGGDRSKDIGMGEVGPEGLIRRPKAVLHEFGGAAAVAHFAQDVGSPCVVSEMKAPVVATSITWYSAPWTAIFSAAGNEALLGVVCNVGRYYGIHMTHDTIRAYHVDASQTRVDQRVQDLCHAGVEETINSVRACTLREAVQLAGWDVAKE